MKASRSASMSSPSGTAGCCTSSTWVATISRADLDAGAEDPAAYARFDQAVQRLAPAGGVISIYYHPNEFVTTEFWDAVNFSLGANPRASAWVKPLAAPPPNPNAATAFCAALSNTCRAYPASASPPPMNCSACSSSPSPTPWTALSVAAHPQPPDYLRRTAGPGAVACRHASRAARPRARHRGRSHFGRRDHVLATLHSSRRVRARPPDAADFIRRNRRPPSEVFIGAATLSLPDFTATLAGSVLTPASDVRVLRGQVEFERYFATDPPGLSVAHPPRGLLRPQLLDSAVCRAGRSNRRGWPKPGVESTPAAAPPDAPEVIGAIEKSLG